jgi:hypothetical protein
LEQDIPMRALAICLAIFLPGAAFATCPMAKTDLDSGIHLTSDSPESIRYRRDAQGHVLTETFPLGDFVFSYLSTTMFGLYRLQDATAYLGESMPDSLASMSFAIPSGNLPEPTAGLAFHSPVQISGSDAGSIVFITVGEPQQTEFGDCTYETLPVTLRMTGAKDDTLSRLHYIPQLGLAVRWMTGSFDTPPQQVANIRISLDQPEGMPPP